MKRYKNIKWIFGFLLMGWLTACGTEQEIPEPDNLIEEPEMVDVLGDVCKVEARFQRRLTVGKVNIDEMVEHNYRIVMEEHNITLTQFKDSYTYYEQDPSKLQQIFDSVIVHLTEEQSILEKEAPKKEAPIKEYK